MPQLNICAVPEFTSGQQLPQPLCAKLTCLQCRVLGTGSCAAKVGEAGAPTSTHRVWLGNDMIEEDVAQGRAGQQLGGCDVEGGQVFSKCGVGGGKQRQGRTAASGNGCGDVQHQRCRRADIKTLSTTLQCACLVCQPLCAISRYSQGATCCSAHFAVDRAPPRTKAKVCFKSCVHAQPAVGCFETELLCNR